MKQPKQVVLVGVIAMAIPSSDTHPPVWVLLQQTAVGHLKARRLSSEQPQKFVDTEVEPSGNGLELLGRFG